MDLAQWWRERKWVALLELIDQLPFASRLNEAVQNDPVQARLIAKAAPAAEGEWSPRVSEFDLHAAMLREIIHGLLGVQQAVIVAAGGKAPKVPTYPAPVTEVDRQAAKATREWADELVRIFTPHASL